MKVPAVKSQARRHFSCSQEGIYIKAEQKGRNKKLYVGIVVLTPKVMEIIVLCDLTVCIPLETNRSLG
jgi:hypothetical protein